MNSAPAVPRGRRQRCAPVRGSSWAVEQTDHPREVVKVALAPAVGNRTEAAYARSDLFDRRRRLMDEWAVYLDGSQGRR